MPMRRKCAAVMCSVCRICSCVTASNAWRRDTWMLTRTVRKPGQLSIMRTGNCATGTPWCAAASACRYSVCPGWSIPAADRASLWMGAVTTARARPSSAASAAQRMQSAAIRPATALICPKGTGPVRSQAWSTARRSGGSVCKTSSVSTGCTCSASGAWAGRVSSSARCRVGTSPATTTSRNSDGRWRTAAAMISGPMPAGSPMVITRGRPGL